MRPVISGMVYLVGNCMHHDSECNVTTISVLFKGLNKSGSTASLDEMGDDDEDLVTKLKRRRLLAAKAAEEKKKKEVEERQL